MNQKPATVLICPGQGAQRAGGVTDLADSFDELPEAGQSTFRLASEIVGCDLWQLGLSARQDDEAALRQPSLLQPFLVAWAVAEFAVIAQRIGPLSFVTGHSSGMNSAMVLSGAVDLEAALQFAWQCGKNMDRDCQERPGGLLALVGAGRSAAEQIAALTGASLANHNAPDQTVLGGAHDALAEASRIAPEYGGQPVSLRVAGAFHTSAFERSDSLNRGLINSLPIADGFTPIVGNHSGQIVKSAEQLREELRSQYVRAVEWQSVLNTFYELGVRRYLTLGPGNVMAGLVRRYGKTLPERIEIRRTSQLRS